MNGELDILGFKFRPIIVVICIFVGAVLGASTLCSCSKLMLTDIQEGFGSAMSSRPITLPGKRGDRKHLFLFRY